MSDKEYKNQQKRVKKYLDKWQKPCGFGWFSINVEFDRERDHDEPGTLGKCWSNWQYRQGTIKFYLPVVEEQRDDELEMSVIHELCHLIVSPLQDFSTPEKREITEYTTTTVAEALYWAHTQVKKGKDDAPTRKGRPNQAADQAEESEEPRDVRTKSPKPVCENETLRDATRGKGDYYRLS